MGSETPAWLTKQFIKYALEGGKSAPDQGSIIVDSMEVDRPIAKGDNYVCEILRAKVAYRRLDKDLEKEPRNISLIIKTPIIGGMHASILEMGLPQKEVSIYNKYLPRMNKLLGAADSITAKSFYSDQENVLVLEDLKSKGFVMADRQRQLDYDHCVLALKTLAVFHAASVKLHEDDPELVEEVGEEVFFTEDVKGFNEEFARLPFKLMAKECKQYPQLSRFSDQLMAYSETSWELFQELVKPKDNWINVLNHGDFWVNNMLFGYENSKPVGLYLMDFQISRFSSPAIDLMYFINSSAQEDVRAKRMDELLNAYRTELNLNLEKFGSKQRLKESELEEMMNASEFFSMFVSIWLFPIITADPKDGVLDFSETTEDQLKDLDNNPFGQYYKHKMFIETIGIRLAEFEQKGWF